MAQLELLLAAGLARDALDARRGRTVAAQRDHVGHNRSRSRKQCLDAAVAPVTHPALELAGARLMLDPGAVADALHLAADRHLLDGVAHFFNPRKSAVRVFMSASRVTRAVSSEDASPFRFFGAVPSRNALSVS